MTSSITIPISLICTFTPVVNVGAPPVQVHVPPFQTQVPPLQTQVPPFQEYVPPFQAHYPPFQARVPRFEAQVPPCQHCPGPMQDHATEPDFPRAHMPIPPTGQCSHRKPQGRHSMCQPAPQNMQYKFPTEQIVTSMPLDTVIQRFAPDDQTHSDTSSQCYSLDDESIYEQDALAEDFQKDTDLRMAQENRGVDRKTATTTIKIYLPPTDQDHSRSNPDTREQASSSKGLVSQEKGIIPYIEAKASPEGPVSQDYGNIPDDPTQAPSTEAPVLQDYGAVDDDPVNTPLKPGRISRYLSFRRRKVSVSKPDEQDATPSEQPLAQRAASERRPSKSFGMNDGPSLSLPRRILDSLASNTATITHIEVEPSISITTCMHLILRAPALRVLVVNLREASSNDEQWPNRPLPLQSSLERLSIKTSVRPRQLLTSLKLPNLTNLKLNALHGDFSREVNLGLRKLLENSYCSLKSLSLIDVYPRQTELISCLHHKACETLQELTIRSTLPSEVTTPYIRRCITSMTIRALAAKTDTGPALCPNLKRLQLSYCDSSSKIFLDMVKTRVGPGPFHIEYAFRHRGTDSDLVARELAVLSDTHPLTFRVTQVQVISADTL